MAGRGSAGGDWVVATTPAVAGLATLCTAMALSSVLTGTLWVVYLGVAIAVIAGVGVLLRSVRVPAPLVPFGQFLALACLLVTIFTRTGVLVVLPGPQSLGDLVGVLGAALEEVQTGIPPVPDSPAMRCLVMLAIGVVAVVVDTLAVAAAAPAASGLVLLCVFAVPVSLADEMLPLWIFVLGAAAFALLLAVDGQHRHSAWRGRLPRGAGVNSAPAATAVAGAAVVTALLAGLLSAPLVGTVGRLPGTGEGGGTGKLGLEPMTELRGMLNRGQNKELFRVRDLPRQAYMRVATLRAYEPDQGFRLGGSMQSGVRANDGEVPRGAGYDPDAKTEVLEIEPVDWLDNWLPVYGRPRRIESLEDEWRFDPEREMLYSQQRREVDRYRLETVLDTPTDEQLRQATALGEGPGGEKINEEYLDAPGVDQRVIDLAEQVTASAQNPFDRAKALHDYFKDPANGFQYKLETKDDLASGALVDFVFNGKTGFCEQYATAMAIMARTLGLPSRVAVGFTAGFPSAEYQTITTDDAHAWVEIYFDGYGWMTFDPTPLSDRAVVPPYISGNRVENEDGASSSQATTTTTTAVPSSSANPSASTSADAAAQGQQDDGGNRVPAWHLIALVGALALAALLAAVALLGRRPGGGERAVSGRVKRVLVAGAAGSGVAALALTAALLSWWLAAVVAVGAVAAAPAALREATRRARLRRVAALGPDAAGAAWQELIAESLDRGAGVRSTETVRVAARRLVREHNLDEQGRDGLRAVVGAVERSWYSANGGADPTLPTAVDEVRRSLTRNAPLALRAKVLPKSVLQKPPDGKES
ncbi:transglutaminaseTgpA domain-containing protein [Actinosynnema mirum]|uniref:Transglutaminase domain protein n=1 Tax=Actinosynnema mirum (strain ATCC 29888 / DSM 43827 / JCM 3225 / NBRC 14064 / NCIMB 13271 / NRRL B-12336 / IMRU 3971 / 101) TaxID=446462 RepID=C6WDF4_ACTMD|nr:DUF3488 and transglutaminase-like domain-containing protein [Actinosynnema mirum]ACU39591.1 transglutaminase domain protein [Actinosynnema mirum DSM 43827]